MNISNIFETLTNAAASRNYTSTLIGFGGALVFVGALDHDHAQMLVDGVQQIMDGFGQMVGGAKKVYLALIPLGMIVTAKFAGNAQKKSSDALTLPAQLAAIIENPKVIIPGKILVTDPKVAEAVPSPKVVAAPQ